MFTPMNLNLVEAYLPEAQSEPSASLGVAYT